jgi:hypothetical protein
MIMPPRAGGRKRVSIFHGYNSFGNCGYWKHTLVTSAAALPQNFRKVWIYALWQERERAQMFNFLQDMLHLTLYSPLLASLSLSVCSSPRTIIALKRFLFPARRTHTHAYAYNEDTFCPLAPLSLSLSRRRRRQAKENSLNYSTRELLERKILKRITRWKFFVTFPLVSLSRFHLRAGALVRAP